MPERLLKYMNLLWARKIREGVERLPAIIPIVTYNGLEKDWDVEQEIVSEFDIFKDDIFRYAVVNIAKVDVKALLEEREDVLSPIVFYLEQVRDDTEKLIERLKELVPKLQSLSQTNMERFLIWAGNVIRPRFPKEEREKYDKLAQELKQGGVKKMGEFVSNVGRLLDEAQMRKFNEGRIEGKEEVAKKLIKKGFSDEDIAELTELDVERIKELRKELIN